jgi:GAF domain-containing protein
MTRSRDGSDPLGVVVIPAVNAHDARVRHLLRLAEKLGERACRDLDASEVTVNWFDAAQQRWVTIANIGSLGVGEERFPAGETYARSRFPRVTELLEDGQGYIGVLYAADCLPEVARVLALFGRSSCLGAPLNADDGKLWGELYLTRDYGRPVFTHHDLERAVALAAKAGPRLARASNAP